MLRNAFRRVSGSQLTNRLLLKCVKNQWTFWARPNDWRFVADLIKCCMTFLASVWFHDGTEYLGCGFGCSWRSAWLWVNQAFKWKTVNFDWIKLNCFVSFVPCASFQLSIQDDKICVNGRQMEWPRLLSAWRKDINCFNVWKQRLFYGVTVSVMVLAVALGRGPGDGAGTAFKVLIAFPFPNAFIIHHFLISNIDRFYCNPPTDDPSVVCTQPVLLPVLVLVLWCRGNIPQSYIRMI